MSVYDDKPAQLARYQSWDRKRSVLFRSLLEYRWALAFDRLHLVWEYEPRSFQMPNGRVYTPDFYIEGVGYIEIKPVMQALMDVEDKLHDFALWKGDDRFFSIHADAPSIAGSVIEWVVGGVQLISKKEALGLFCAKSDRSFKREHPDLYADFVDKSLSMVRKARPDDMAALGEALWHRTPERVVFSDEVSL